MSDIVEWLRGEAKECYRSRHTRWIDPDYLEKAADEIERLRAIRDELVASNVEMEFYINVPPNDKDPVWLGIRKRGAAALAKAKEAQP